MVLLNFESFSNEKVKLHSGWKAKRATEIVVDGTVITSNSFRFFDWMEAVVPGTVLTTLLHNQKIPDPFFGMNNEQIPDISQTGPEYYTYWFYNNFDIPELAEGEQLWLNFRGINYLAEIYLNGKRVNTDTHEGMFLREKYLITPYIEKTGNRLAVLVKPPVPVGIPGGQGGDGTIARSVTMQFTAGWDWICPIRDRNTGIWDEVSLEKTGPVDMLDPFVKTKVPGKRLPAGEQSPAYISHSVDLTNISDKSIFGKVVVKCAEQVVQKAVEIKGREKVTVELPEITVQNPKLWWPNGTGDQPLYETEISFVMNDGKQSDKEKVRFGIREITSRYDERTGGRIFSVNGQDIFIKGGNWIASDALLRLSATRYEAEVKMHQSMNMNMIRVWGGGLTERPEFYDACDKYGILVWQDLWVSGDCNGRWLDPMKKETQAARRFYPEKHSLFIRTAIDQIKMLRNHPSLALWCGGNEFPPPADIDKQLKEEIFPTCDGTRYYLNESTSSDLSKNTVGTETADGPYGIQEPSVFFSFTSFPFNPETGSVGMPNVESLRKIMEEKDMTVPGQMRENPVWRYHKYIGYDKHIDKYGHPNTISDFCRKAQLANYEQYRAMQEGYSSKMWKNYTGMLVWKNQNPWTALRGQFYDVFLEQNGGFYGYMHGANPLHLFIDLKDSSVWLVNQTLFAYPNLTARAEIFDIHGKLLKSDSYTLNAAENKVIFVGKPDLSGIEEEIYFVRLKLMDNTGKMAHSNFYWMANPGKNYEKLNELKPVALDVKTEKTENGKYMVKITNPSGETAFFIRLKPVWKGTSELVLPVFFSDNYFTLLPGESRVVETDMTSLRDENSKLWSAGKVELVTEGWNITESRSFF